MSEPVGLRLGSNFHDFYDHHFAGSCRTDLPLWSRQSRTARTRGEDHALLEWAGFECPAPRGPLASFDDEDRVVAYVDPRSHHGEGKRQATVETLLRSGIEGSTYAVPFLDAQEPGVSLRLLAVGRSIFWLTYRTRTPGEWRSNAGDVEIAWAEPTVEFQLLGMRAAEKLQRKLGEPLIAVDFVDEGSDMPTAVDLNTAPGIAGTPVEHCNGPVTALHMAQGIAMRWRELAVEGEVRS